MNKTLNIIPTPKKCEFTKGKELDVSRVFCTWNYGKRLENAIALLAKETSIAMCAKDDADLIVTNTPEEYFEASELKFFEEKFAKEEGYILKKSEDGPVVIGAYTEIGCAYGIMTLLQILGLEVGSIVIRDWPDFNLRSNMWTIWAELGLWSYDFGDGLDALKERIRRKMDMCMRYKINGVYVDAFGLKTDRFPEYTDIMRHANDMARERGVRLYTGCYGMSYGMSGYGKNYQGSVFTNRKSYPDGEVYECIGSYNAYTPLCYEGEFDRKTRMTQVYSREHGTCLSNEALFDIKAKEMEDYIRKTHAGGFYIHNMDSHEIHPELWWARCPECRKKWPSDDLFTKDGAAGAFAEYFSKLGKRLCQVKDGDYDAKEAFKIFLISPGYCYSVTTNDEDYETAVRFWSAVSQFMDEDTDMISIGFREQYFYQEKDALRPEFLKECKFNHDVSVLNFCGADGFYDDKIFTITASLNYMLKDYDGIIGANGNAFQEPLQIYNAEYLWGCENSSFYNLEERPTNHKDFMYHINEEIESRIRPDAIYKDGGMLDIICEKHYGKKIGKRMSEIFKIAGDNGEPPVLCASSVDIYTGYNQPIYPMRWDNEEITPEKIAEMKERFLQCRNSSKKAHEIMTEVMADADKNSEMYADLVWFAECVEVGARLTTMLYDYMVIYDELDSSFKAGKAIRESLKDDINKLRPEIEEYMKWVKSLSRKALDALGGSVVRREEMGEHLDYWTSIMLSSIKTSKRIPDDVRPLAEKKWW